MRTFRLFRSLLTISQLWLVCVCVLCPAARAQRAASKAEERAYSRAMARLSRAKTLYVKVHDALTHQDTEYRFRKPNMYRISRSDGDEIVSDGRIRVHTSSDGRSTRDSAPHTFPEEVRLMDFRSFFESKPKIGELMGVDTIQFGDGKRRAFWVKTTESAIEYGQAFLSPVTMLPLGHHTSERDEITVDLYYPVLKLNPSLPAAYFVPSAR